MAASSSGSVSTYKQYTRGTRTLLTEADFTLGMMYTNNALDEGYARTLINFDYKDDGMALTPRGGLRAVDTIELPLSASKKFKYPFAAFTSNVNLLDNNYLEDYRTKCFIVAESQEEAVSLPEYAPERKAILFPNKEALLYVQDPVTEKFTVSALSQALPKNTDEPADAEETEESPGWQDTIMFLGEGYNSTQNIHGFKLETLGPHKPIHTQLNNTTYLMYKQTNTTNKLGMGKFIINKKPDGTLYHKCVPVDAMKLTVKEVLNSGYNMLLDEPYSFANQQAAAYSIDGILPYSAPPTEAGRELLLSARPGQKIYFEAVYQYKVETNVKLRAKWEWIDPNGTADWQVLQTQLASNSTVPSAAISPDYTAGDPIYLMFEPTIGTFQLRVSLYTKTSSTIATDPVKVLVMPIYRLNSEGVMTANLKPAKYKLPTASGMTTWKQRLILWGVSGAENILFTSDVNNPTYFPYPNNIDIFDENIIHVTGYLDNLVVFTETRIYQLTLTEDGLGFTNSLIQDRLSISPMDKHVVQVIKNMIYFKSDNYYYMIVPKTNSIKGELLIAPISKPIKNLFDNFEDAVRRVISDVYFKTAPREYVLKLINYYNYVDNTVVRNVYTFQCSPPEDTIFPFDSFNFNFVINYDTTTRTWSIYMYQCNYILLPFKQTITDSTTLLDVCNRTEDGELVAAYAQLIRADPLDPADNFLLNDAVGERLFPNYQFVDTGYRKMGDQYEKRFREVQMKLNNTSGRKLEFFSEFVLDEDIRKTYYKYEAKHITDPNETNFGLYYLEKVFEPTITSAGTTSLAEDAHDYNMWTLDFSKHPELAVAKIKFPVSGKGYAPRLKLVSFNEQTYELLNINWVFRTLNAR